MDPVVPASPTTPPGAARSGEPAATPAGTPAPWTVIVLTVRDPRTDFRLPLARELAALGHEVLYVFLKRRPVVTRLSPAPSTPRTTGIPALVGELRRAAGAGERVLVLNSTNLVMPGLTAALRLAVPGLWCLDLHDDLLYDFSGWRRLRGRIALGVLERCADIAVHAAPTLRELFPASRHLGNASDLRPVARGGFDASRVLVLASVDARFDFDFMARAAALAPEVAFDIHGGVSRGDPLIAGRLRSLASAPNVHHHGPYDNAALPGLLAAYAVTLAPYVVGSRLTRYIDPLRYYHCLNAGMEVITTGIPAAEALARHLHVVASPEDAVATLARLGADPAARRNDGSTASTHTWAAKARRLIQIAAEVRGGAHA
jgi:hypothetical protein